MRQADVVTLRLADALETMSMLDKEISRLIVYASMLADRTRATACIRACGRKSCSSRRHSTRKRVHRAGDPARSKTALEKFITEGPG
jgi:hypothetical protein